jgi:hypothetical protein
MTTKLTEAIAELNETNEAFFNARKLSPLEHSHARSAALVKGVIALAEKSGVQLEPIYGIDSRGELRIVAAPGNKFGETFSALLNKYCKPRTGVIPTAVMTADASWCYINHFDAERLVLQGGLE